MSEVLRKVCGLTRPDDVALCHDLKADFTGFIFVEKSMRRITPAAAADMPRGAARRVGVFSGEEPDTVRDVARQARLDLIQLHGGEEPEFCRAIGSERVIKTLWPDRLSQEELLLELERFAPVCAYFLLDAGTSGGGSGRNLDWSSLRPLIFPRPWLMAGGLGPDTLGAALSACSPNGVDMNSALESAPGVKDHVLLRKAFAIVTLCSGSAAGHIQEEGT